MTKLLTTALEAVSRLSDEEQDDIARAIIGLTDLYAEPQAIPPEDREAVLEGLAQAERGEFATDEEVEAAFARFRR